MSSHSNRHTSWSTTDRSVNPQAQRRDYNRQIAGWSSSASTLAPRDARYAWGVRPPRPSSTFKAVDALVKSGRRAKNALTRNNKDNTEDQSRYKQQLAASQPSSSYGGGSSVSYSSHRPSSSAHSSWEAERQTSRNGSAFANSSAASAYDAASMYSDFSTQTTRPLLKDSTADSTNDSPTSRK